MSSFTVNDPGWKYKKAFGSESFNFQCESGLSIEAPKILITQETHWAGPIVPIFPVHSTRNHGDSELALRIEIIGNIGVVRPQLESVELSLLTDHSSLKGAVEHHIEDSWAVINAVFPVAIGNLNNFSIILSQPIPGCKVSEIHYTKQENSNNEFILSPGP